MARWDPLAGALTVFAHLDRRAGVHLGVHDPRTLRHSSDSSDTGKGNELAKSFIRCLLPVTLKSLDPLGHVGSTPTPGTIIKDEMGRS